MRSFSYQLYSSRNFGPLPETLKMVAGLGYAQVEGYGGLYADLADLGRLRQELDVNGLAMPTGHFSLDMVTEQPARVLEIVRALDMQAVIVPAIPADERVKSAADWAAFGRTLAQAGQYVQEAGIIFGWHNHAFEFAGIDSAGTPLELILAGSDDLALELDLAWAAKAGQDPVRWLGKYAERIIAVHVKDIAPEGANSDEDGWADVGQGVMNWARIVPAVDATAARYLVIEHDNPSDDARFARRSIEAARAFQGEK